MNEDYCYYYCKNELKNVVERVYFPEPCEKR